MPAMNLDDETREQYLAAYSRYPSDVAHEIDWSGMTAVIVCNLCGLQEGAFFSEDEARSACVVHRQTTHENLPARVPRQCRLWTSADAKRWRPRIAATLPAPCVDCGRDVYPEHAWQVGHIEPLASFEAEGYAGSATAENLGPSHTACNQRAGGRMGAAKTNGTKRVKTRTERGLPEW